MSKNLDRLGFDGLITEYRSRGYSIGLTDSESGGDDGAKERCEQRFLLFRIMLVHPEMSLSEFKVCSFLLLFKYNDHTGRCDPGVDTIALATNLQPRTVRKALDRLERILGLLVYARGTWKDGRLVSGDANTGGTKSDTNVYSFQCPPLSGETGVKREPKKPPLSARAPTPVLADRPTPVLPGHSPLSCRTGKQLREQPMDQPIDQVRSLARTTHAVSRSESKIEEAKEASKGTSEGEPVSPPVTSKVRSRLEAIPKAKVAKRLDTHACAHCGVADDAMMPYASPNGPVRLHMDCYSAYWAATFPPPPPVEADTAPPVWPPNPDTQTLN